MQTVLIIGTNHKYQRETPLVHAEEIRMFREYLAEAVLSNGAAALAEEMSNYALQEHGLSISVVQEVAHQLGIPHDLSDPSPEDRDRLGIRPSNDIEMAGLYSDTDMADIEAQIRESFDIRENYWVSRLSALNFYPVIFICGSTHAISFQDKLLSNGHDARVFAVNWVPGNGA